MAWDGLCEEADSLSACQPDEKNGKRVGFSGIGALEGESLITKFSTGDG
jgi:hypothetical protein